MCACGLYHDRPPKKIDSTAAYTEPIMVRCHTFRSSSFVHVHRSVHKSTSMKGNKLVKLAKFDASLKPTKIFLNKYATSRQIRPIGVTEENGATCSAYAKCVLVSPLCLQIMFSVLPVDLRTCSRQAAPSCGGLAR